jgi:enoyl-[acyl-carrier protein] reductase III
VTGARAKAPPASTRPRIAVVTGGTRGIGGAVSLALARDGATVFALYARNRTAAERLAADAAAGGLDVRCLRGDLTRAEDLEATLAALRAATERVDVVVHAAASGVHRRPFELTPRHLRFTLETNVVAIHALLRELAPMIPAGGRIIGLTSAGSVRTGTHYAAVGASKAALDSLFRHYAVELAPRGIAVNLVSPGLVETGALNAFPDRDERIAETLRQTPTGRLTTPEDVARLVRFLASDEAAQIVGQTFAIDGGKYLAG